MSYESMKQTADLDYSLELGVGMPEHGMLSFSVGVVRMDGRRPYGFLLLVTVYDNGGQRSPRGRAPQMAALLCRHPSNGSVSTFHEHV